jgi:SpoIID/LytB domain protein
MGGSRRTFLRSLGSGMVLGAAGLWLPRRAGASDLSLSDRIDLLYSNQFHFDERGEPRITIGLMSGRTEVLISAPGPVQVLPSGDGGTSIEGGSRLRIALATGTPGRQRWGVVLESLPAGDGRAVATATARWRKRGLTVVEHEVGALFGVRGKVLDTRRVLLAAGDYASEEDAAAQARLLKQRHGALGGLHPTIEHRGEGTIIATDLEHDVKIRAEGVLWLAPPPGAALTVHGVPRDSSTGASGREDRSYRGQIYVAIDRFGKLSVVNLVGETDILAGLVPAEIFASAPAEALRAQAVAARGQLLTKLGTRHLDDPFLVCAEQHCQVYAGKGREHPRTDEAVRATKGQVLMRPDGVRMVDTVYSANCGGHTEDNDQVWPSPADAQLRGRADPLVAERFASGIDEQNVAAWLHSVPESYSKPRGEHLAGAYRWSQALDPAAISGNPDVPAALGKVVSLQVRARGRSGRATVLRVTGERGEIDVAGELRIRRALGGLRSSMFVVAPERDEFGRFVLHGGGHGHGVGLCQHGAIGMAHAGKSTASILAHYYRDSKLEKLW